MLPNAASGRQSPHATTRSKSGTARGASTTSQARFGYLGHLSLLNAQDDPDVLRNVNALDSTSFLPNVMTMQRASTPWQYNTPNRVLEEAVLGDTKPAEEEGEAGQKQPEKKESRIASQAPLPANYVRRIRRRAQNAGKSETKDYRQHIADLKMLADSASRSGNIYQALQAYHRMGVVLDNEGKFVEAIEKYKQFLSLCITSKNTQGEALAYNCLGIDCFKTGQYDECIQYHNKHLELADATGRLIAHTNLGIAFQAMGLAEHAAIHHQHAIEYANRMGAKDAQCFTVGNLGVASAEQGDYQTSRICLQYHLTAAQRQKQFLGDTKFANQTLKTVSNVAYHRLGQVNTTDGRLDEAASQFAKAMEVAKSKGDQTSQERSGAMLGIARGLQSFNQHCEALVKTSDGNELAVS
jgi:tetratricopeptide (TPR) repeat protein